MKILLTGLFSLVTFFVGGNENVDLRTLKKDLKGEWVYACSKIGEEYRILPADDHCPVWRLVYQTCDDRTVLSRMPESVKNMRKTNVLANLSCTAFHQNGGKIDTYFPVIHQSAAASVPTAHYTNYGNKFKTQQRISRITPDSLFLSDNKVHFIDDQRFTQVQHIYLRN